MSFLYKCVQQAEFSLFGVWVNYTIYILRYWRRFEGKIYDLVDSKSGVHPNS